LLTAYDRIVSIDKANLTIIFLKKNIERFITETLAK